MTGAATMAMTAGYAVVLAVGLNGLGVLRSLHRAGIGAVAVVGSRRDLPALSRRWLARHVVPDGERWEEDVAALLRRIAGPQRVPLIACSDRAANFLQDHRTELERHYALLVPDARIIETLNDKRLEYEAVARCGVPLPRTITDLEAALADSRECPIQFPVIIKPRTFEGYALLGSKNLVARDPGQWRAFLSAHGAILGQLILQQVVEGDDSNLWVCNATADRSHRLAGAFCFRRLGTSPSHYGVTSLARSESNPRIVAKVQEIVRAIGYVGPLMMEFKYDPASDRYVYIETNPRLGMCNWFDTRCGVNNVAISCALATGQPAGTPPVQQDGPVFVNGLADLVSRLEDRESPVSILRRYCALCPAPKVWATLDAADPLPFLYSTAEGLRSLAVRVVRHAGRCVTGWSSGGAR